MTRRSKGAYIQVALLCSLAVVVACGTDAPSGPPVGGAMTGTGGTKATGTGGGSASGGSQATGGNESTGGTVNTGGTTRTGGVSATGGVAQTGGTQSTGGIRQTGGIQATGGVRQTGGTIATGGVTTTGGVTATGGIVRTGGTSAMGGTVTPDAGAKDTGSSAADTASLVSFKNQILPLMQSKCISCHGPTAPKMGIRLDTYANVKANAKAAASEINAGKMPETGGLPTADRQMFQAWVNQGMLDN